MASLIFLGSLYPKQHPVHSKNTFWNLDDIRCDSDNIETASLAFIAKGNIIEGIEAKE